MLALMATTAEPLLRHKLAADLPAHESGGGAEAELDLTAVGQGRKLLWCIVDCNVRFAKSIRPSRPQQGR